LQGVIEFLRSIILKTIVTDSRHFISEKSPKKRAKASSLIRVVVAWRTRLISTYQEQNKPEGCSGIW
jgi:hypothetical protein